MSIVKYDRSKFVFSELFINADGKTSGSGFIGVILGIIAGAGIIAGTVGYFLEISNTLEYFAVILKLITAVTILLGVRKVSGDLNSKKIAEADAIITETAIKAENAALAKAKAEEKG